MTEQSVFNPAYASVLTINGGSSSIKFALYQVGEPLERKLFGSIDHIGQGDTSIRFINNSL